jgi:hypothetical protein
VTLGSAPVTIHIRVPVERVYAERIRKPFATEHSFSRQSVFIEFAPLTADVAGEQPGCRFTSLALITDISRRILTSVTDT